MSSFLESQELRKHYKEVRKLIKISENIIKQSRISKLIEIKTKYSLIRIKLIKISR